MKNFLNIVVVVVVLGIIGGIVYVVWPRETIPHDFEPVATTTVSAITFETKTITDESIESKYTVSTEYPLFSGGIPSAMSKINKAIDYQIKNQIGVFKKNATELLKDLPPVLMDSEERSFIEIKYEVSTDLLDKGIISIDFATLYYMKSAAHPGHSIETLNFNATTGNTLELKDLFVSGYLEKISALTIAKLKSTLIDESSDEHIQDGAGPEKENYDAFSFDKEGMTIFFSDYQVAPYAAGPQDVVLTYAELKDIIDPNGILAPFK